MGTLVYELWIGNPPSGVTAVLSDLLRMDLPPGLPDAVSVVGLDVHSERASDINRLMRNGRVLSRDELNQLLGEAEVQYGWFFVGAPGRVGDAVPPVDVPAMLRQSAFAVDVLEGWYLGVHSVHESLRNAARAVIAGEAEIFQRELEQVRLAY
jgi:hypothetical protein